MRLEIQLQQEVIVNKQLYCPLEKRSQVLLQPAYPNSSAQALPHADTIISSYQWHIEQRIISEVPCRADTSIGFHQWQIDWRIVDEMSCRADTSISTHQWQIDWRFVVVSPSSSLKNQESPSMLDTAIKHFETYKRPTQEPDEDMPMD